MREIKFRVWDGEEMMYPGHVGGSFWTVGDLLNRYEENRMQFTGLKDSSGKEIYEGDVLEFWVCYPTWQTHEGDNIIHGSYTEPDEPELHKIQGTVHWDDDRLEYYVWVTNAPYYYYQMLGDVFADDRHPITGRSYFYSRDDIKRIFIDDWDEGEFNEWLQEEHGLTIDGLLEQINNLVVIGNIHEHPHLMEVK